MSHSGVDLQVGQKIYFNYKGERQLLLEVDESIRDQKVNVTQLIKERIKQKN